MAKGDCNITRITRWPRDFAELADSVTRGLAPFYGEAGCSIYRQHAEAIFGAYLSQPGMRWWAYREDGRVQSTLLTRLHNGRGELTLGHRLQEESTVESECGLVLEAVADLQAQGADCVLAEFMPTSPFRGLECLPAMGFECFGREFMRCPQLGKPGQLRGARPIRPADRESAGDCIVSAYRDSHERLLHRETHGVDQAGQLVSRALAGEFGATAPGMNLGVWEGSQCLAIALGCVLAPGIGFTIQLATRPEAQGRGLARGLLQAQHAAFAARQCHCATLAVTATNARARELYQGLGYETVARFNAYVWYREESAD